MLTKQFESNVTCVSLSLSSWPLGRPKIKSLPTLWSNGHVSLAVGFLKRGLMSLQTNTLYFRPNPLSLSLSLVCRFGGFFRCSQSTFLVNYFWNNPKKWLFLMRTSPLWLNPQPYKVKIRTRIWNRSWDCAIVHILNLKSAEIVQFLNWVFYFFF